jgi:hypothetical protein
MNLEACERKWPWPTFRNNLGIYLERLRIAMENLSQSSQNLGKDLNSREFEHEPDHSLAFSSDRERDRQTERQMDRQTSRTPKIIFSYLGVVRMCKSVQRPIFYSQSQIFSHMYAKYLGLENRD